MKYGEKKNTKTLANSAGRTTLKKNATGHYRRVGSRKKTLGAKRKVLTTPWLGSKKLSTTPPETRKESKWENEKSKNGDSSEKRNVGSVKVRPPVVK